VDSDGVSVFEVGLAEGVNGIIMLTLHEIAETVRGGGSHSETVRELLRRFNFERRGVFKVQRVRHELAQEGLRTDPDFVQVWIDAPIAFRLVDQPQLIEEVTVVTAVGTCASVDEFVQAAISTVVDPTYRVNRLEAANQALVVLSPNDDIARATTLMMAHDFSQLPVMSGERNLRGMITWKTLGMRLALGTVPANVQEAMEEPSVVGEDSSLFAIIPLIIEKDYVLVRRRDQTYSGIITTADLSGKFHELAEPFLLLGEIENHLRILLDGRFTLAELQSAKDPGDVERLVESAADLTLGEILHLLENPESWEKLRVRLDRREVIARLGQVKNIRNDVMHFDPEGIGPADIVTLRVFARFIRDIRRTAPE